MRARGGGIAGETVARGVVAGHGGGEVVGCGLVVVGGLMVLGVGERS